MSLHVALLLSVLVAQPLANEDVLEPSVENEVAHALSRAPRAVAAQSPSPAERAFVGLYATNGLSASAAAIRLVSSQQADGRWRAGTNDVTRAAVALLRRLLGDGEASKGETDEEAEKDANHETSVPK